MNMHNEPNRKKYEEIEKLLLHQLKQYWIEIDEKIIIKAIPSAISKVENSFIGLPNRYYYDDGKPQFSPYISVHWLIFLYRLAHDIYKHSNTIPKEADLIYYLNKVLHSNVGFMR